MNDAGEGALPVGEFALLVKPSLLYGMGSFDLIVMVDDVVVSADIIDHCG